MSVPFSTSSGLPLASVSGIMLVSIPKLIIQTWSTDQIPSSLRMNRESVSKHMPDWSHVFMNALEMREFASLYFPEFIGMYDSYAHDLQRAQAFRYMWLFINGGLYLDLDTTLEAPIDHLFYEGNGLFLVRDSGKRQYSSSFMASTAGHPFWLQMLEAMKIAPYEKPIWARGRRLSISHTTGDAVLTKTFENGTIPATVIPRKILPVSRGDDSAEIEGRYPALPLSIDGSGRLESGEALTELCLQRPWLTALALLLLMIFVFYAALYLIRRLQICRRRWASHVIYTRCD